MNNDLDKHIRNPWRESLAELVAIHDEGMIGTKRYRTTMTTARAALAEQPASADTLCQRLQYQCSEWGAYWAAPDAHGVELSIEQAAELLRLALGVEVEIKGNVA